MKKVGRLNKLSNLTYQLQYWGKEDLSYQVTETSSQYKKFKNKNEAIKFTKKNNIKLQKVNN